MPKIIQLCDGIMASGLQPVSHGTVHMFYANPYDLLTPFSSHPIPFQIGNDKLKNYIILKASKKLLFSFPGTVTIWQGVNSLLSILYTF